MEHSPYIFWDLNQQNQILNKDEIHRKLHLLMVQYMDVKPNLNIKNIILL